MSKLLYIPSGTFCSFHRNGSGIRTLIIEESAVYEEQCNIEKSIEAVLRAIKDSRLNFAKVNNISTPILREEFEVVSE
ncbi:MAG: hypothetical protein JHC33_02235 [Ignisphaera sp.]|nr:hypothetical protein [Ignisphaera sp.]